MYELLRFKRVSEVEMQKNKNDKSVLYGRIVPVVQLKKTWAVLLKHICLKYKGAARIITWVTRAMLGWVGRRLAWLWGRVRRFWACNMSTERMTQKNKMVKNKKPSWAIKYLELMFCTSNPVYVILTLWGLWLWDDDLSRLQWCGNRVARLHQNKLRQTLLL